MASRNHSRAASAGRVRRWPGRDGVQRRLLRRSGGDAQCVRDAAGNADVLVEQLMVVVHGTVGVLAELGQAPLEFSCLDAVESFYGLCRGTRSEEHTSELQSLMRISYAVFCLKKKQK